MATLADLSRVTQDQIARLKLRGKTAELEELKTRLPETYRALVDEVQPAVGGWTSRRSVSRRTDARVPEKVQASVSLTAGAEPIVSQPNVITDPSAVQQSLDEIKAQLAILQQTSGFKKEPSLLYEGIKNDWVRRQLVMDNIRMEHALLDTAAYPMFSDKLAFRFFCAFAFLQVEEMLNYLYWCRFGDDMEWLAASFDKLGIKIRSFRGDPPKKLSEVQSAGKIQAYNEEFCGETWTLYSDLNRIRNVENHRCTVLFQDAKGVINANELGAVTALNKLTPHTVRDYLRQMYEQIIADPACP